MIRAFKFKSQYISERGYEGRLVRASYTLPGVIEITNEKEPRFKKDGGPVAIEITPLIKDIYNNADRDPCTGYEIGCSNVGIYKKRLYIYFMDTFFVLWNKEMKLKDWKRGANERYEELQIILNENEIRDIRIKEKK